MVSMLRLFELFGLLWMILKPKVIYIFATWQKDIYILILFNETYFKFADNWTQNKMWNIGYVSTFNENTSFFQTNNTQLG